MRPAERLTRLAWWFVSLALTGLTGIALLALLGGLVNAVPALLALGLCALMWWQLIAFLRRSNDAQALTPSAAAITQAQDIQTSTDTTSVTLSKRIAQTLRQLHTDRALRSNRVARATHAHSAQLIGVACLALAIGIYALTRFAFIESYPIFFFTDEAIHPVYASELLKNGLRNAQGDFLPPYFQNGLYWNLSLSVYIHLLTVALFGKSVAVTRATSALVSLLGMLALGLTMKLIFKQKYYWIVVLFLAMTPAWFLHSRTAFETVLMASFYACFLLCYLLYLYRTPAFLFPALVFGAATFYSYASGQAVMLVSGVLLLISDIRYHVKQRRVTLLGVGLLILLALPYLRFRSEHPDAITSQLHILDSYLFQPISTQEKVLRFIGEYTRGLSPIYWFFPNESDLERHRMKGYGHIMVWTLPFFLTGLGVCIRNYRSSAHRAVLIAALAAPFGGALAQVSVTRALMFVIPAAIFSALGFEWLVSRLRSVRAQALAAAGGTAVLSIASLGLWSDALTHGPTWYRNYGLFGMQWGAQRLFGEAAPNYLQRNPGTILLLSPSWANGTDVFERFFESDPTRVQLSNIDHFLFKKEPLDERFRFVMTPDEVDRANASKKFKPLQFEEIIPAPDGTNAFYFTRVAYADDADAIFSEELEARRRLVTSTVFIAGEAIDIAHSRLDMGQAQDMFDGDPFTLARGMDANPFVVEFDFAKPRPVRGLDAIFGKMDFRLKAQLFEEGSSQPVEYSSTYQGLPGEPTVSLDFPGAPTNVSKVHVEILQLNAPQDVHVHVRELKLR